MEQGVNDVGLPEIIIDKGRSERLYIDPWMSDKSKPPRYLVSIGNWYLVPGADGGEYRPKKSIGLSAAEARELSAALLVIAEEVDALNKAREEAALQRGEI